MDFWKVAEIVLLINALVNLPFFQPMESIVSNVEPTVQIPMIIRPVYNFKAGK